MSDNTDKLITELCGDLKPVCCMCHPLKRAARWLLVSSVYIALVVLALGMRDDIAAKFSDTSFLIENGLMALIGVSAAFASAWLCVPDMRGARWMKFLPLIGMAAFVGWEVFRSMGEGVHMPHLHYWDHCFGSAALIGFVPMAALMFTSRGGATTQPLLMALMNVIAVGALGYIGLRFVCASDTIGHAAVYHLVPFMALGIITGLTARRLYRW